MRSGVNLPRLIHRKAQRIVLLQNVAVGVGVNLRLKSSCSPSSVRGFRWLILRLFCLANIVAVRGIGIHGALRIGRRRVDMLQQTDASASSDKFPDCEPLIALRTVSRLYDDGAIAALTDV